MNKLAQLIEALDPRELLLLQRDLDRGDVERLISKQLQAHADTGRKVCPVCGMKVFVQESLKLEFGPLDLRQRAHFDGPDCLRFFMEARLT